MEDLSPKARWVLLMAAMDGFGQPRRIQREPAEAEEPNTGDPFMDGAIRMSRGSTVEAEIQRLKDNGVIKS